MTTQGEWRSWKSCEVTLTEARAQEVVERFERALDRQSARLNAGAWSHAPKHIREAHGDPSLPDPPSGEAIDAWANWLVDRRHSLWRCRENLEKGRDAVRNDPARVEVYWKRAISTAERVLAEIDEGPDALELEAVEYEDVPDDVIAGYLALLEENRGRQVVNDSVLPAPAAPLRAALERRYQRSPDLALAEALIALPVFVPPEDAIAVERFLMRRTGKVGPIGKATWDHGLQVVRRIAREQQVAMRRTLDSRGSGATSPIPVLGGVADAQTGAVALASAERASAEYASAKESAAQHVRAVQLLLFLGWVPTGLTAIISGVIVGFLTGNIGSALAVIVGGTLVGWIAMLVLVFTVGNDLEQNGSIGRPGVFEAISVVFGVIVTIAFAAYIA